MIVKASFILFAIVLPLVVLGVLSVAAFWAWGGQGACFLPPLFGVYFFALLVMFEVQKRRNTPKTCRQCGAERVKGQRACGSCGDAGGDVSSYDGDCGGDGGGDGGGD